METVFRLKASEFNANFLKRMMLVLGDDRNAEITISYSSTPRVGKKESRNEYKANLDAAIENLEQNRNTVAFTGEEFRALTQKLLKK
jgi:hypothetical protein